MTTAVHKLLAAGLCVLPAKKSKAPAVDWKRYQSGLPLADEIDELFANAPHGLGVVCGKVSGGLEVLDLDAKNDAGLIARAEKAFAEIAPGLWQRLPRERTPTGGAHLYFRSPAPEGNSKLARSADGAKEIAETRGEGGFVVCAPTPGYVMEQGALESIPTLTADERETVLCAARSLDLAPEKKFDPPTRVNGAEVSPVDDYNARGDVLDLLRQHGWHVYPERGDGSHYLRRPDKPHGVSATFNRTGRRTLCVFSSSTPFEISPTTHSPAGVFAVLECSGNFSQAASELRRLGYGSKATPPTADETPRMADSAGHEMKWDDLLAFDPKADPDCLMGNRYLGRTSGLVLVGPSGIGKSVAALQLGACATLGKPFLGLVMRYRLRVLYVQAEDDLGDVAEAVQGFVKGYTLTPDELAELKTSLRILRWNDCAGVKFLTRLRAELAKWPCDLVIVNPLFSFCGCPVSDQAEMSAFLRNGLNPILNEAKAACVVIHHTNKPNADPNEAPSDASEIQSYVGSGSAELTNWARAYVTLQTLKASGGKIYKMIFAKRGKRAGLVDNEGKPTTHVLVEHSSHGLCWLPSDWTQAKDTAGKFAPKFDLDKARVMYDPAKDWPENERAIATAQGVSRKTVQRARQTILDTV